MRTQKDKIIIQIAGVNKCGTVWLTRLLNKHPEITAIQEEFSYRTKSYRENAVVIIRDPIDRTISHFNFGKQTGAIPLNLGIEEALQKYKWLIDDSHYEKYISENVLVVNYGNAWRSVLNKYRLTKLQEPIIKQKNQTGGKFYGIVYRNIPKWMKEYKPFTPIKYILLSISKQSKTQIEDGVRDYLTAEFSDTYDWLSYNN